MRAIEQNICTVYNAVKFVDEIQKYENSMNATEMGSLFLKCL